jgi:hypothetical protein
VKDLRWLFLEKILEGLASVERTGGQSFGNGGGLSGLLI